MTTPTTHTPPADFSNAAHCLYGIEEHERPRVVSIAHLLAAANKFGEENTSATIEDQGKLNWLRQFTEHTNYRAVVVPQETPRAWIDLPEVLVTFTVSRRLLAEAALACILEEVEVCGFVGDFEFQNILSWVRRFYPGGPSVRVRLAVVRGQQ
jgi:hypothetical protein